MLRFALLIIFVLLPKIIFATQIFSSPDTSSILPIPEDKSNIQNQTIQLQPSSKNPEQTMTPSQQNFLAYPSSTEPVASQSPVLNPELMAQIPGFLAQIKEIFDKAMSCAPTSFPIPNYTYMIYSIEGWKNDKCMIKLEYQSDKAKMTVLECNLSKPTLALYAKVISNLFQPDLKLNTQQVKSLTDAFSKECH